MLRAHERQKMLEFITKYAGDDIIIAAMNRTTQNLDDTKVLMEWVNTYRPNVAPVGDYGTKPKEDPEEPKEVDKNVMRGMVEKSLTNPEDLGPAPKKLGSNGQAIQKLMTKEPVDWSVEGLHNRLKLPLGKIKPMLALMLERKIIKRTGNFTYMIDL